MAGLAQVLSLGIRHLSKNWWPEALGEREDWVSTASPLDL